MKSPFKILPSKKCHGRCCNFKMILCGSRSFYFLKVFIQFFSLDESHFFFRLNDINCIKSTQCQFVEPTTSICMLFDSTSRLF